MSRSFFTLIISTLAAAVHAAPVSITPGSLTYAQNFDSLGTLAAVWADDATIPGWYAQINNGATAAGNLQPADGTTLLSGLLNLGAAGAGDRALGSKATGTNNLANIACAVSFRNNGTRPVGLSQLQYAGELWRTNSGTGTPPVPVNEEYTVFFRLSSSPVTNILSGPTSVNAAPGSGFIAVGSAANWTNPVNTPLATALNGNAAANRTVVTVQPVNIIVMPGQYLLLKWTDANEAGTDGFQGLDDISVQFAELDGEITPAVSAPVRDSRGTPADPADDLFGFTVNVAASGAGPGPGWSTPDVQPPNAATEAYGTPVTWTGFPVTAAKSVTFSDTTIPLYNASISVPVPKLIGVNTLVPGGIVHLGLDPLDEWVADETLRTLTLNDGGGVVAAAPVSLAGVSGVVQFSARLTARDTSSGFETDDTFLARLFLHDGTNETEVNLVAGRDSDGSGAMNGGEIAPGGGTPAGPTLREFTLLHLIPDNIQSARVVLSGTNNSANETLIVDNILFSIALRAITAATGAVTVNNQGTDTAADDTFTAPVTVAAGNNAPSTGWTSDSPPPWSGNYSAPQPVTFGPFPVSGGAKTVTLTDQAHPVTAVMTLTPSVPALSVSAPANIVRHGNGPGLADDTVTFDVTITGSNGGPRWVAGGAANAAGAFGAATLTVPVTVTPAVVTVADVSYPSTLQSLSIPIPPRYTLGWYYDGASLTDIFSDVAATPAAEWVNDPVLRTLDMSTGGTSDKVVASDVINLSAAGTVWFSAVFRAREASITSNFESQDRFLTELVLDGGTASAQIINLITPWDTGNGSSAVGAGGGPNGPRDGWLNGYTGTAIAPATAPDDYNANKGRDEFNRAGLDASLSLDNNFALSYTIPAAVNSVQLRVVGSGISSTEFFTVSRVTFSTVSPGHDSDSDGVPDLSELAGGTDPHNPASLFTLTGITTGPGGEQIVSFPTVSGRLYRGYLSADLQTWTRDDSGPAVSGDGNPKTWPFPVVAPRHYLKVLSGFTPADFPATLP